MRTRIQLQPKVSTKLKLSTKLVYASAGLAIISVMGFLAFLYMNFGNPVTGQLQVHGMAQQHPQR
jgi:hypothetical protein